MGNYYFLIYSALLSPEDLNTMPSFELHAEKKPYKFCGGLPQQGGSAYKEIQEHARQEGWVCSIERRKAKGRTSCHFFKLSNRYRKTDPNSSLWCTVPRMRGKCHRLQENKFRQDTEENRFYG